MLSSDNSGFNKYQQHTIGTDLNMNKLSVKDKNLNSNCTLVTHLTLLHSERPKLHTILAFLSAVGLNMNFALLHLDCVYVHAFMIYVACPS